MVRANAKRLAQKYSVNLRECFLLTLTFWYSEPYLSLVTSSPRVLNFLIRNLCYAIGKTIRYVSIASEIAKVILSSPLSNLGCITAYIVPMQTRK